MSKNLPTKSSSRGGRFKKKLVPEESLEKEAPVIQDRMAPVKAALLSGSISESEFAAIYIVSVLSFRYPGTWLGAKAIGPVVGQHKLNYQLANLWPYFEPNIQKRLAGFTTVGEVFSHFALKSTPLTVNRAILQWSNGIYGLELMFRIPRPEEVLNQQKRGRRCVTVILEKEKASRLILGERDALGFTMHDLIHADHFYHNNHSYQGQLGFYGFLDFCVREKHFELLLQDEKFGLEFEYLIADMNAYAIHLLKCFKSALIHYHPHKELYFHEWLARFELNEDVSKAFTALNTQSYEEKTQDGVLLEYLKRWTHTTNSLNV
jgi:hypothetical protein